MKIGELARTAGVSASSIRFYERHGLLPAATRNGNGYRDYPYSAVNTLSFILQAKGLGFSLQEIKRGMPRTVEGMRACDQVLEPLCSKLNELDGVIRQLCERRDIIAGFIMRLRAKEAEEQSNLECGHLKLVSSPPQRRETSA